MVGDLKLTNKLNSKGIAEWWVEHKNGEQAAGSYTAPVHASATTQANGATPPLKLMMWRMHETDNGVLLRTAKGTEVWLPKAEIRMEEQAQMEGDGFEARFDVTIPGWLAKKKGLTAGEAIPMPDTKIPF
jgi:hypothetical protein